jgi:hypothetical protein
MDTLGLWLGPLVAVVVTAGVSKWLGWFQPKSKRRVALRRIAERLAWEDSQGYDYQYERYLEHYLGGRDWHEEADKMSTQDKDGNWCDARGPALKWWQLAARRISGGHS